MENWDEVRTAFHVARLGTVSGAAEVLGVHHATVIRHIDALERRLGTRLFQRHARGYTATEAGRDLLAVAQATEERFAQLSNRIRGQGQAVAGELVVTAIAGLGGLLAPVLAAFQRDYPEATVRVLTDARVFRLDYGEAHVAVRAGAAPEEPDNVVQPLVRLRNALYAARSYVERHGVPAGPGDFARHRFIAAEDGQSRAPYYRWLRENAPDAALAFRASEPAVLSCALRAGAGIGFLPVFEAEGDADLVPVMPPRPDWDAPLWLVTHVDLHRTAKVQAILAHLKRAAAGWAV